MKDIPGTLATRWLDDGRVLAVAPLTFGRARLTIGADTYTYDDGWCYDSPTSAIAEMNRWNGEGEPRGWMRNPQTGRRRPDGDPGQEYVMP